VARHLGDALDLDHKLGIDEVLPFAGEVLLRDGRKERAQCRAATHMEMFRSRDMAHHNAQFYSLELRRLDGTRAVVTARWTGEELQTALQRIIRFESRDWSPATTLYWLEIKDKNEALRFVTTWDWTGEDRRLTFRELCRLAQPNSGELESEIAGRLAQRPRASCQEQEPTSCISRGTGTTGW
jgi:hypothetical protein